MEKFIAYEPGELKTLIKTALTEHQEEQKKLLGEKLYTINQVRILLGRGHQTIKNLCENGKIRTTKSGLIPESALLEYLNSPKK